MKVSRGTDYKSAPAWGVEFGIGPFSFGGLVYTNDPLSEAISAGKNSKNAVIDKPAPGWGYNRGNNKTWENGKVLLAPAYVGLRLGNTINRIGVSHRGVQNVLQNGIHYLLKAQNYYLNYESMQGPFYYYNGFSNSNSIYQ